MAVLILLQISTGGFDVPLVAPITAMIALPVKFLVDVVKGGWPSLPSQFLPVIGIVTAFAFAVLVVVAGNIEFSRSVLSQCGIAAVGAQIAAMASTWNQNRADKIDEKIQTALDAKKGTTRAEVDATVKAQKTT